MPAEFVKCVDTMMGEGKSKDSAYAMCTVQYKKRHKGQTPQMDEHMKDKKMGMSDIAPTQEEIASLAFLYEELAACKKKKK